MTARGGMALGRQGERQADLMLSWTELPRSPGHAFHDRLQAILVGAGFDRFAEGQCAPHYASKRGRPSLPPGRYFRMRLVGYFEGIDSERGLEWHCADSLSLREFLRLGATEPVPDHPWLSKTRARLPLEVHEAVFARVLERLAEHGLIEGDRIGVDASTMEANAARLTGKGRQTIYRAIEAGALSASRDAHGRATVDIAELERVYGPLGRPEASRDAPPEALADDTGRLAVLEERVRQLEERVQDQHRELNTVREEKGRLLGLLEVQTRALADLRERPRLESAGLVERAKRWLFGRAPVAAIGASQDSRGASSS